MDDRGAIITAVCILMLAGFVILIAPDLARATGSGTPPTITVNYPSDFLKPVEHDVVFTAEADGGVFVGPPSGSQYSCVLSRGNTLITCTVTENIYSADDAIDIEAKSPSGAVAFTGPILVTTIGTRLAAPPPAKALGDSSVLFIPGTEASRLYVRDELGAERQVWEPDFFTDIPYLAMNADGTSKYDLYTKDIIDSTYGNTPAEHAAALQALGPDAIGVYDGFETFMDGLVANKTIREWRAYPYDWRYDVRDVVANGTMTKQRDGSVARVYLGDVLKEMASTSATGKVTIVAHSNGGLVAKALAIALGGDAARYIDRIILVGSPQWGTPAAIGALLHADNFAGTPSLILDPADARAVADTMPDSYDMLPSAAYFAHATGPVVTFDPGGSLSRSFSARFGSALASFASLADFLTDSFGLDTYIGSAEDIRAPIPLPASLLSKAAAMHAALDAWKPPPSIHVSAIIGWGQETVRGLAYRDASEAACTDVGLLAQACENVPVLRHEAITTEDGDGTVLALSAAGDTADKTYFDAARFRADKRGDFLHARVMSAAPVQAAIRSILDGSGEQISNPYISTAEPSSRSQSLTVISAHSPVTILATDAAGRETGIVPILGTDFFGTKQEIPGSSVQILGDEKYLYLPSGASYTMTAKGYASGGATIEIGSLQPDGTIENVKSFDIPVTPSTKATLVVPKDINVNAALSVDENGNGHPDDEIAPVTDAFVDTRASIPASSEHSSNAAPKNWSQTEEETPAVLAPPGITVPNEVHKNASPSVNVVSHADLLSWISDMLHSFWRLFVDALQKI